LPVAVAGLACGGGSGAGHEPLSMALPGNACVQGRRPWRPCCESFARWLWVFLPWEAVATRCSVVVGGRQCLRNKIREAAMRTGLARQDARDDFDRARRRASWAQLTGWLHGRPSGRLPVLGEVMTTSTAGPTVDAVAPDRRTPQGGPLHDKTALLLTLARCNYIRKNSATSRDGRI
jgi:hypothetical protein